MASNGRNRGYIGRNEITSPQGVIDSRQSYLNEESLRNNYGTNWVRPTDWLQIPGYTFGEQVAYALLAVTDSELDSNSVGFTVISNFIVDWGDGSTGSFAANTTVRRSYNYNSVSSDTLTSEGFKQILIKITAPSGTNLGNPFLNVAGITSASSNMQSKWLEVHVNVPNANNFGVSSVYLKKLVINRISNTASPISLANVPFMESFYFPPDYQNITLGGALSLKSAGQCNFAKTSYASVFFNCGLDSLPEWNYSQATSVDQLARFSTIKSVPFILSCPNVLTSTNTAFFSDCRKLKYVKGINFPNLANTASGCFQNCSVLEEIGGITLSKITNITNFCISCVNLTKIGSFDGGTGIQNTTNAFNGCTRLKDAPQIDLRNCTNATNMFASCSSLVNVPGYTFGNNATVLAMFSGCSNLRKLPSMDWGNLSVIDTGTSNTTRCFFGCFALEEFPVKNLRVSMNLTNCRFGFTALSEIFAGLTGISGPSATLNITGNPGATFITAAQIAGATALGWTITR